MIPTHGLDKILDKSQKQYLLLNPFTRYSSKPDIKKKIFSIIKVLFLFSVKRPTPIEKDRKAKKKVIYLDDGNIPQCFFTVFPSRDVVLNLF